MQEITRKQLYDVCRRMRKDILDMAFRCGTMGAHLGGSLSLVEILAVLYFLHFKFNVQAPDAETRDRFILSKAHSVMAQYSVLHQIGILTDDDISHFMTSSDFLFKHPKMNVKKGIEFSGGSLGQGLSLGVGTALALMRKGNLTSKVYVVLGDGECDEGSVYEASVAAVHYNLRNLTIIIDCNGLQNDGTTSQIMRKDNLAKRWESVGFRVIEVNGHDIMEIDDALSQSENEQDRCCVIFAHTVKGKGISFAENVVDWHVGYLTKELYDQAVKELTNYDGV